MPDTSTGEQPSETTPSARASVPGVFPNQTAKEVRLEAYFRGEFRVWNRLEAVQARLRDEFPDVLMPRVLALGEPLALRPYYLRSANRERLIGVALNQVSLVTHVYRGHQVFIPQAVSMISSVLGDFGIEQLERVVYQYDNELGLPQLAGGTIPVHEVLRLDLAVDGKDVGPFYDVELRSSRGWTKGKLHTRVAVDRVGSDHGELAGHVLRFMIAAEVVPAGPVTQLEALAHEAHARAYECFESMATTDFKAYLQGGGST